MKQRRQTDITKRKTSKPLSKKSTLFIAIPKSSTMGTMGSSSKGPHIKKSAKGRKIYYIAVHNQSEYFGLEILNQIGFNTPKGRPIINTISKSNKKSSASNIASLKIENLENEEEIEEINPNAKPEMAIKAIEGFIPIRVFIKKDLELIFVKANPFWKQIAAQYSLDVQKQVIIDNYTHEEYKISGNLFSANIGSNLLEDFDLQPDNANIGLVKVGNRFYAYLIDKEHVKFDGTDYERSLKILKILNNSYLFKFTKRDQNLYIIHETAKALDAKIFQEIFLNPRVKATTFVKSLEDDFNFDKMIGSDINPEKMAVNFEKTVQSAIHFYKQEYGNDFEKFEKRELIRKQIANEVIQRLEKDFVLNAKEMLFDIILEDLRAPYYEKDFKNQKFITEDDAQNQVLKDKIYADQAKELKASATMHLFFDIKNFIFTEKKHLTQKNSKDNNDLESTIESVDESFSYKPPDEQQKILRSIIRQLDIITQEITSRTTAVFETAWIKFKNNHKDDFNLINPSAAKEESQKVYKNYL